MCLDSIRLQETGDEPRKVYRIHLILLPRDGEPIKGNHLHEVSPFQNTPVLYAITSYCDTDDDGYHFFDIHSQAGWHVFLHEAEANAVCESFNKYWLTHKDRYGDCIFFVRPLLIPDGTKYWTGINDFFTAFEDIPTYTAECARTLVLNAI